MEISQLRRGTPRRIAVIFLAALLLGGTCEKDLPAPENNRITQLLGMCSANSPFPSTLPIVDFWFDDSLSMAGYVTVPSAYRRVVRRLAEGTVQAGYPPTIRTFSNTEARPLSSFGEVLTPKFYPAIDTRLSAVLETIAQTRQEAPKQERIAVMFADLIQSEGSRDALSIAAALRRVAAQYPYVVLYGFRSAFRGTYYVETPPRRKVAIDTLDGIGRPFYVLVMATSYEGLRQFQRFAGLHELVADHTLDPHTFEPSLPPIEVNSLDQHVEPGNVPWDGYGAPATWKCTTGRRSQINSFIANDTTPQGPAELTFDLKGSAKVPLVVPSRFQADIRRIRLSPDQIVAAPDATVMVDGAVAQPSGRLTYRFPAVPPGEWHVYAVRLRAGDANLLTPDWIAKWSTDDDSTEQSMDKTLNLTTFGDALLRALTEQTVFLEHIVELYRGK